MVGIVAAMGGEVEGDGEALLAARKIGAIESVGLLRRREARILAHRPRLVDIHRGVGAAHIRGQARPGVEIWQAVEIGWAVERFDGNPLGREPRLGGGGLGGADLAEGDLREVRDQHERRTSSRAGVASIAGRGNLAVRPRSQTESI
jgi:hypothetical protein